MRHNVLEFTRGMPEVMVGNALVAEVKWDNGLALDDADGLGIAREQSL